MRESSKIEKTKLPGDTYEAWLRTQRRQPERGRSPEKYTPDSYDAWIRKRVETRIQETKAKRKRVTG